jgi:Ca2+/Na+ antiporter
MTRRLRNRREGGGAPGLLVGFCAATLVMVVAIVVLLRGSSDWVDFVAIALLLALTALVLLGVTREVDEEEPPDDDR